MASTKITKRLVKIPMGGNAFITKFGDENSPEVITDFGLGNWMDTNTICSAFFKLYIPENFHVGIRVKKVPTGYSKIRISVPGRESYEVTIEGPEYYIQDIGTFSCDDSGYVQMDFQGIFKVGEYFGDVAEIILSNIHGDVIYISDPELFYFGRRGPSVHFRFEPESDVPVEYFYNEIKVPIGQDIIGAYYMATGFSGGYFGIQVNSETERRILFSVWSEYDTDDPEQIPEEYRVVELRRGEGVVVNDFGNEGSGKQSFLRFPWKTEETYKFLINGIPIDEDNTKFTAWFKAPASDWRLIASFCKPKVSLHLESLYSFSENFSPNNGHMNRTVHFTNQWVRDTNKDWKEIVETVFTGDETSRNGREDFAGGVTEDGKNFFLKNCGFFDEKVDTGLEFIRIPSNEIPDVDVENLP